MSLENRDLISFLSSGISAWLLFSGGYIISSLLMSSIFLYYSRKFYTVLQRTRIKVPPDFNVLVVGSGVSGICMGKKLNDAGIKYTILEKASDLGGTWHYNNYPGVACDIASHLYSYSFFPNPRWSREYSKGPEIKEYLQKAASKFNVYPHIKFGKRVESAVWDDAAALWRVHTSDGEVYSANVLVSGTGALHVPRWPTFPGIKSFKGEYFHTAEWDTSFDPTGKRVAVIGTGASAVQTVPSLSTMGVKSLKVFQRTPCWSPKRWDRTYPEWVKTMFEVLPFTNTIFRYFHFLTNELFFYVAFTSSTWMSRKASDYVHGIVRRGYYKVLKDKELAERLMPTFSMGCKRITPSDTYIKSFLKDNVHLVTDKIEDITPNGIKTISKPGGETTLEEREFDAIIYATGFDLLAASRPYKQVGLKGAVLSETFGDSPLAYLGISHDQNPNCFWLLGPGTGLGHNTIIYMIECQADYAIDAIQKLIESKARSMVVKPEVQANYWEWVKQNMKGKVFADNSSCVGWYRNERGVNWTLWPLDLTAYWWNTRHCDLDKYTLKY